jgi:hypothetical protein
MMLGKSDARNLDAAIRGFSYALRAESVNTRRQGFENFSSSLAGRRTHAVL